jgi:pyridoxine 4-dehydrogenase
MAVTTPPGGTFSMAEDLTVTRMGYGAMQLAGPGVFGPPKDRDEAIAVLRETVELGRVSDVERCFTSMIG